MRPSRADCLALLLALSVSLATCSLAANTRPTDANDPLAPRQWGMPADLGWQAYSLTRPVVRDAIRVTALGYKSTTARVSEYQRQFQQAGTGVAPRPPNPTLGVVRSLTLLAPNGALIEAYKSEG